MANRLIRAIPSPFQVTFRGQPVTVTHERAYIWGGALDTFHVQWQPGYFPEPGVFQRVTVPDDARTAVRDHKLEAVDMQAIMDAPGRNGNFSLDDVIAAADLKPPTVFRGQAVQRLR